jgi:hypothetical protein
MVCLPAFHPEWAVTLVLEDGPTLDAPHTYYVEYVAARSKLFTTVDPETLTAEKSRAALDAATAQAVNRAWRRMLHRTRYSTRFQGGADGVDYHFSRFVPLGLYEHLPGHEQGSIWTPADGSPCGDLVALGERLRDYTRAKPDERDKIASEIRAMADRLWERLERRERRTPTRHLRHLPPPRRRSGSIDQHARPRRDAEEETSWRTAQPSISLTSTACSTSVLIAHEVVMATSAASRPTAIGTRAGRTPSNVASTSCQAPPR